MRTFTLVPLFALLTALSITLAKQGTRSTGIRKLATFDDLKPFPALPEVNPVGRYMGLNFKSFDLFRRGVGGTSPTGIIPQSDDQLAVAGLITGTTMGYPALIPVSPYKTFNLRSLYFACAINTLQSLATVPEQCVVAFTAYLPGSTVAYQTINQHFSPTNPILSKMQKATFPTSWAKMGKVEVAVIQSTSTSTLASLFLDDVDYSLYK